jgi:hypothetical protein
VPTMPVGVVDALADGVLNPRLDGDVRSPEKK